MLDTALLASPELTPAANVPNCKVGTYMSGSNDSTKGEHGYKAVAMHLNLRSPLGIGPSLSSLALPGAADEIHWKHVQVLPRTSLTSTSLFRSWPVSPASSAHRDLVTALCPADYNRHTYHHLLDLSCTRSRAFQISWELSACADQPWTPAQPTLSLSYHRRRVITYLALQDRRRISYSFPWARKMARKTSSGPLNSPRQREALSFVSSFFAHKLTSRYSPMIKVDATEASATLLPEPAKVPAHDQDGPDRLTSTEPTVHSWPSPGKDTAQTQPHADTTFDGESYQSQNPSSVSVTQAPESFLAVPSNMPTGKNSAETGSIFSLRSNGSGPRIVRASSPNDSFMSKKSTPKRDQGQEDPFCVPDNPFAFTPGQLGELLNPKNLSAFYALGGLAGLEAGLQSDRKAGLNIDEDHVTGRISFEQATQRISQDHLGEKESRPARQDASTTVSGKGEEHFTDRRRVFKDNHLPRKKGRSLLRLMWITYKDKVLFLLTGAALVSLAIGIYQTIGHPKPAQAAEDAAAKGIEGDDPGGPQIEWVEGVAIMIAIVIVVVVGSFIDYSKERQFAKLNRKKQDRIVKVVRSGKTIELSVFDILVGDVVHLEPGDLVPVDGILIGGFNVKCDESQATGESDIIKKKAADHVFAAIENGENTEKLDPFILSGSRVMEGMGTFMVTSTGVYSTYGQTLMALNEDPEVTPLQSKLNVIANFDAKIALGAAVLLFFGLMAKFLEKNIINKSGVDKLSDTTKIVQGVLNPVIMAVSILVVAIPEGLPLAVTLALAFATIRMVKDNNLVRHLKACEVMGNATNICSDKTGTLTQNKMQVVAGTIGISNRFGFQFLDSSPAEAARAGGGDGVSMAKFAALLSTPAKEILVDSIALNSTAFEGDVDGKMVFIGSKTETALLILAQEHLGMGPVSEHRANASTLQLIPFDSGRKCMGIVVQLPQGGARLYVKGASEIVLARCTHMLKNPSVDAAVEAMSTENHRLITRLINSYASQSLRTIGLAYKEFDKWPPRTYRRHDGEKDEVPFEVIFRHMIFVGMVGIQDPLRAGVSDAVMTCRKAGVCVRMVTGDNKITAEAIARACGILQPDSIIMEGPEFRNLTHDRQLEIMPRLHVLARSSPQDKQILVKRLKEQGEIVAVTGDGTNDAPALKTADVGFSMGIAGTEVAKEASAIVLMDDDFNSIVKALM